MPPPKKGTAKTAQSVQMDLAHQMAEFFADPYGFVIFSYPWGQAGTALVGFTGDRK